MEQTRLAAHPRLRRIEGRHNPLVKQLRQAFAHSELTDAGDCAIEGLRILEEAIRSGLRFSSVFFRESAQSAAERLLPQIGAQVETLLLPDKLFDSLVPSESPQGVAALVRLKQFSLEDVLERLQVGPIIALASLQDPGNLGTILRSAEAFGATGAVCLPGTVSPWNPKAMRASAGSIFRLPLIWAKPARSLEALRAAGVQTLAAMARDAQSLGGHDLAKPVALLIGAEGSGIPPELAAQCDARVMIPCPGPVESLNAAVAASVLLYEASRQRALTSPASKKQRHP